MSDLNSQLPVPVSNTQETKEMKLKWLQAAKQEKISRIVHLKQTIEDLLKGKIPEVERQILLAEQELKNLETAEAKIKESVDTTTL